MKAGEYIVVGVDGDWTGDEALMFAADEARRTGDEVIVLTAWQIEPSPVSPRNLLPGNPTLDQLEVHARARQDGAITRVFGDRPDVPLERRVHRGDAGQSLVEAARWARMLVVGSRPMRGARAVFVGSVSRYCVAHALCPVAIVPSNWIPGTDQRDDEADGC